MKKINSKNKKITTRKAIVKCEICGTQMSADQDLCPKCHAPIGVKALGELNTLETDLALHALMATLGQERLEYIQRLAEGKAKPLTDRGRHWLKTWLNLYWLRPGNAVIKAVDCIVLEQKKLNLPSPMLDLGCGDGIFTTAWRGFEFSPDFDMYRSLDLKSKDIYDYYEEGAYHGAIIKRGRPIAAGVDIRESLVKKASDLGSFEEVKVGDARKIPYADETFASVFTNILEYFPGDDNTKVLSEIRRVLKKNGEFIAIPLNSFYKKGMLFGPQAIELEARGLTKAAELYRILDRGRSKVNNYLQLSPKEWTKLFEKSGFKVISNTTIRPQKLWKFWDTELRAFSPILMGVAQALESFGMRSAIKKTVVDWLVSYLAMYVDEPYSDTGCSCLIYAKKI